MGALTAKGPLTAWLQVLRLSRHHQLQGEAKQDDVDALADPCKVPPYEQQSLTATVPPTLLSWYVDSSEVPRTRKPPIMLS